MQWNVGHINQMKNKILKYKLKQVILKGLNEGRDKSLPAVIDFELYGYRKGITILRIFPDNIRVESVVPDDLKEYVEKLYQINQLYEVSGEQIAS